MRPTPYISVSGLMPQDGGELLSKVGISSVLNRQWPMDFPLTQRGHLLALGILTSRKTLYGDGNKYPLRYPQRDALELAAAPPEVPVLNVLHHFQEEDATRAEAIRDAIALVERSGKRVHAVQVNSLEWPMPSTIANVARLGRRVILQVRTHWYKGGRDLARWMRDYAWAVDDVLLDGSGGRNEPFDVGLVTNAVLEMALEYPNLGVTVAGGINAAALRPGSLLYRLLAAHQDLSVCAEGGLRDDAPGGGNLDHDAAAAYVKAASAAFGATIGGR